MTTIPTCGKGTRNGATAQASRFLFAACVKLAGHGGSCDSGPTEDDAPPDAA